MHDYDHDMVMFTIEQLHRIIDAKWDFSDRDIGTMIKMAYKTEKDRWDRAEEDHLRCLRLEGFEELAYR